MSKAAEKHIKENYEPESAPFSWDKLDGLLAYKSSLVVCSDILECGQTTIKDHISWRYGLTYTEYADRKLSRTRVKLVQKAIEQATSGNSTMLIFCLKNLCGWADKMETAHDLKGINLLIDSDDSKL